MPDTDSLDPTAAPLGEASRQPILLRTLTTALPEEENLDPAAPDPDLIPGEETALTPEQVAVGGLVELLHEQRVAEPLQKPPEDYTGSHVVFRLSVVLPLGDSRIPSMDLLIRRARAVVDGELLTPPEEVEGQFAGRSAIGDKVSSLRAAQGLAAARKRSGKGSGGRPCYPRRGIIVTESGDKFEFRTMVELAHQLGAAYVNVCAKYRLACVLAHLDPNDHDGVTFKYITDTVTVTTR